MRFLFFKIFFYTFCRNRSESIVVKTNWNVADYVPTFDHHQTFNKWIFIGNSVFVFHDFCRNWSKSIELLLRFYLMQSELIWFLIREFKWSPDGRFTIKEHACTSNICICDFDVVYLVEWETVNASLRSAGIHDLVVPRSRLVSSERAFSVAAPRAWNSLPVDIRLITDTKLFKKKLKTFLFNSAYHGIRQWNFV